MLPALERGKRLNDIRIRTLQKNLVSEARPHLGNLKLWCRLVTWNRALLSKAELVELNEHMDKSFEKAGGRHALLSKP